MLKSVLILLGAVLAAGPASAAASIAGPDAAACRAQKSSVLVRISGFKRASGTVKVAVYGSDPERYLAKGGKLRAVKVPVRSAAPLDVCIAVPAPGRYAIAVHHDLNGNGDKDSNDGAGYSGNPKLSITNLRPAFSRTGFDVGGAPRSVRVELQYREGLSIRPVTS